MTSFALMLQVYELIRSSAAVGAIGLAQAVPVLAVGLLGGSFADAVDRRKLTLLTSGCLAAVSAAFAAQAFLGLGQVWLLYALAAVEAGLPVALFPALNAARFGGAPQTLGLLTAALAACSARRCPARPPASPARAARC